MSHGSPSGARGARVVAARGVLRRLRDAVGERWLHFPAEPRPAVGDWIEVLEWERAVAGEESSEGFDRVIRHRVLRTVPRPRERAEWTAAPACSVRDPVRLKDRFLRALRTCFHERGFLEVETPTLLDAPGQEPHLRPFETRFDGRAAYLSTSPEYAMKRLLVRGHERIFQVARAYRDGRDELSPLHQPEFVLLEWYRAFATLEGLAADLEALLPATARAVAGGTVVGAEGRFCDLSRPLEWLRVEDAFQEFAGLRLESFLDGEPEAFCREAGGARCAGPGDAAARAERAFFRTLIEEVEPRLGRGRATLLCAYPAAQAALAELDPDDPRVASRFELFVLGTELANAFQELCDPAEQRRRFLAESSLREQHGGAPLPIDEDFLAALEDGMPPAAGIALGLDRLLLLLAGGRELGDVLPFARVPPGL